MSFFPLLKLLAKRPGALLSSKVVNWSYLSDDVSRREVCQRWGLPNGLPTIDLLTLLPQFAETVEPYSYLEGTSPTIDLAILKGLARRYRECNYLEIGTWRGESVSNVASVASKCVCITLSASEMREMGISPPFIENHAFFSNNLPNVEHIGHNSQTFDFSRLRNKFDLVFVDGDHSYQGVLADTKNVFRVLRDRTSIIVWHDYGYSPETVRWTTLAGILAGCPEEKRKYLYHISNTMCAVYIEQELHTEFTKFPVLPNKRFTISISAEGLQPPAR